MKNEELKKQEAVNVESETQDVTALNEKLDFSDLENVEGGAGKGIKNEDLTNSDGGNLGVGCVC